MAFCGSTLLTNMFFVQCSIFCINCFLCVMSPNWCFTAMLPGKTYVRLETAVITWPNTHIGWMVANMQIWIWVIQDNIYVTCLPPWSYFLIFLNSELNTFCSIITGTFVYIEIIHLVCHGWNQCHSAYYLLKLRHIAKKWNFTVWHKLVVVLWA